MYISCPNCRTNFVVTKEQLGSHGRKVRCSKCSHIWHARNEEQMVTEPLVLSTKAAPYIASGNGINLPALLPIRIPAYLYALPAVLISLILFLSIILFQDSFGLRSSLTAGKDLSIRDVQVDNQKDLRKIVISYKVMNNSDNITNMPSVRIRLLDKDSRTLKSHIATEQNIILAPRQFVTIRTEFASVPEETEQIDITLGNKLDFILR